MYEVLLNGQAPVTTEIATNGARCRDGGVSCASERAEALDDAVTRDAHGDDGTGSHEINQGLKERLADVLFVVRVQQLGGGRALAHRGNYIALGLDATQNFSGQTAGNAVGLDQDESFLNCHELFAFWASSWAPLTIPYVHIAVNTMPRMNII